MPYGGCDHVSWIYSVILLGILNQYKAFLCPREEVER
jgi:hypothetical protein